MRIGTWTLVGIFCFICAGAAAADQKAEMDAMTKAWMDAATPGAPHQQLASMVGTWDAVVKNWTDPAAPPTETKGVAEMSMVLGGRYLVQQFHGEMMGQPYEGMGYTGYDNVQQKFVSTWMDNMSTGMMLSTGQQDAATKKCAYVGKMWDAMSKSEISCDEVMTVVNNDHHIFEMWMPGPDGKKMKCMEIHYTRKK